MDAIGKIVSIKGQTEGHWMPHTYIVEFDNQSRALTDNVELV